MSARDELAQLGEPACYPQRPTAVQILQTHLSIVCLAGERVFKLKKAIALPFVDFTTLAARRQACRDEVRLNRRLCPDTYLGTASLRRGPAGELRFAAIGDDDGPDDLDVAVVMRRLPQDRMLDELLAHGAVAPAAIEALARHVAAFHARSDPVPSATAMGLPAALAGFAAANFTELTALPAHPLPPKLLAALAAASAQAFALLLPTLAARAAAGHVVDGHGDLHARNVCMTEPPTVYDCIEFEPRFRLGDVATEVAFLVMDLRYRGAPQLATAFVRAYAAARGDDQLPRLLPTLCSYRAMVRAKVAALATGEAELPATQREQQARSAVRHLELAAALQLEADAPLWLALCGPPACGKSSLAQALAAVASWPVLATDVVRKELAGLEPTARAQPEHYTAAFSQATYAALHARAAAAVRALAPIVLLDGNFPTEAHRRELLAAATAAGSRLVVVHVDLDAATAVARARQRAADPHRISDADAAVTQARHAQFVALGDEVPQWLRVDGRKPTQALVHDVLQGLLAFGPG
jgi:aminoglycoside phosphotransferase family enzyme/predicted kinase